MRGRLQTDERGAAVLEFVLLVPVFVLLVYVAVAMGRLGLARVNIDAAARDAARAGSIARSADGAVAAAQTAASDVLGSHDITCANLGVAVDTSEFRPGGWVRVEITCMVSMAELVGMWAPGDKAMRAQGQAVVDTFRGLS